VMMMGAGALAAPAVVMAAHDPVADQAGGRIVVSGRIIGAPDGQPLAGAQVEIWQADARGARAESTREVVITDGDGRYCAAISGRQTQRLYYRVSHHDYTAQVTQMHAASAMRQRSVSLMRDDTGATRAAFEMTLAPRSAVASMTPDFVAL